MVLSTGSREPLIDETDGEGIAEFSRAAFSRDVENRSQHRLHGTAAIRCNPPANIASQQALKPKQHLLSSDVPKKQISNRLERSLITR